MLRKVIRSAVMGAAIVAGIGTGAVAKAETLADALVGAYETSGLLDQQRALLRATDEDVAQAVSALRPIISWVYSNRYTNPQPLGQDSINGSLQLTADLVLWDFGRRQFGVESRKELVLATRQGLVSAEQSILARAVEAFMSVRRDSEILALRQNNVRLITQELRAARDRFEVGEVTRTDVAQAEARLASARAELALARGNLDIAREEYLNVVGRLPGRLVAPRRLPQTANSEEEAKRIALTGHPDLQQAQHEVAAADLNVGAAKAAIKPTLSAQGTATWDDEEYLGTETLTLNFGGPLYRGGELSSLIRQAQQRAVAARANVHIVSDQISQGVGNAFAQLRSATANRQAVARQIRAAQVAFEGVREEATLGARTTLDVLNAEQELLDARASAVSAATQETVAAYAVLSSMGLLTADHLNLNVQVYDPAAYYNAVKNAPTYTSRQGQQLDKVLRALNRD
ncbi:TolC family outer membrane protein [Cognatishimia sp. MH4019]|uniref:TolC family outer membrane protein n=1 Tax=Cognatishimia sp. MH4019 TaxID=2854030 RepID=UPI001CD6B9EB|nr:TolC family outer membrane protein [Cognatishimia sp. MH4019]